MSKQYKMPQDVPNEALASRLDELADAVISRSYGEMSADDLLAELTVRIPVELDRDADCVFREAAERLRGYGAIR